MAASPDDPLSGSPGTYRGPIVSHRSDWPGRQWVWVTNGTVPAPELFTEPRPLSPAGPGVLDQEVATDPETVARVIESFRPEVWRLGEEDDGSWFEDEDEDEPVSDLASGGDASQAAEVRIFSPVEVVG